MRSAISVGRYGQQQACSQLMVLAASLLAEIKQQDVGRPGIDVFDLRDALTGKDVDIDAEALASSLEYWATEVEGFRAPTQEDIAIYTTLFKLNAEYECAQGEAKLAAQNLNACLKRHQKIPAVGDSQARLALYKEQAELADRIVSKMKTEGWTIDAIKADYLRMKEICEQVMLPKMIDIKSKDLLVAHLRNLQAREAVETTRAQAIKLLYSEEGVALNKIFPKSREEICSQLNIVDPTMRVNDHVRYILENGGAMDAYILSENRRRLAAQKKA